LKLMCFLPPDRRMQFKSSRIYPLAVAAVGLLLLTVPAAAQQSTDEPALVYEREVFHYAGVGRVDPFRTLISEDEGVRLEDLTLRGIMHHDDPSMSVASLTQEGTSRRIQARIGQRIGSLRIAAIYPDRVEVVVEELGVARREILMMARRETPTAEESNR
jgi:hypothetical protein